MILVTRTFRFRKLKLVATVATSYSIVGSSPLQLATSYNLQPIDVAELVFDVAEWFFDVGDL